VTEVEHLRADVTAGAAKIGALESAIAQANAELAKYACFVQTVDLWQKSNCFFSWKRSRQKVASLSEENEKHRLTAVAAERGQQTAQV
jgi:hypothetical protein